MAAAIRSPGVWLAMRAYTAGVSVPGTNWGTEMTVTPAGRMLVTRRKFRLAMPASMSARSNAVNSVRPSPAPAAPPVPVGVRAAEGADFGSLRSAGATAVKLVVNWSEVETRQGTFQWDALDDAVSAAQSAGLRVILVLSYTPKWASQATGGELLDPAIYAREPPKRIGDWETFVTAASSRYRDRVKDWQIWTARSLPLFRGTTR